MRGQIKAAVLQHSLHLQSSGHMDCEAEGSYE